MLNYCTHKTVVSSHKTVVSSHKTDDTNIITPAVFDLTTCTLACVWEVKIVDIFLSQSEWTRVMKCGGCQSTGNTTFCKDVLLFC